MARRTNDPVSGKQGDQNALPFVTVIVPTYNRASCLADTLRGLMAQEYPDGRMEIVVVDNSSTDNTEDVVAALQAVSPVKLVFYRKDNRGPAASRNYAIERSTGEVLAFTDSDCHIPPGWVRRGVSLLAEGVGLVAGPVRPMNHPDRIPGFFSHQTDHSKEDFIYATANVFYRRDVVRQAGGFNESFGAYPWGTPVGGEDTQLAWRVKNAGYQAVFASDNPVYHEATNVPFAAWLVEPVRAQIMPRLVREFPALRERLWGRYFLSRESALFYPALTGVCLAALRRNPAPLLLALPWAVSQRSMVERDLRHPARWWRIAMKYGLTAERYFVQSAALAYSSVRHRTPVL
jgi:glycosyltransferase involved in cell wall biosynthesis